MISRPNTTQVRPLARCSVRGWCTRASATVLLAVLAVLTPSLAASAMPNRRAVAIVYCNLSGGNCSRTFGSGPTQYAHLPHGNDRTLGCTWYSSRSTGLGVDKDFCIPAPSTTFAPQGQQAESVSYRPRQLDLAGDGSGYVRNVTWSSWLPGTAIGSGEYGLDDCEPDCGDGTFHYARTTIVLSGPITKCGYRVFTKGLFRFPDGAPIGSPTGAPLTWQLAVFPCEG